MSVESNNKAKSDLKGTGSLNRPNAPLQLTVKQRRAARAASLRLRGFPARVLLSPCERPAAGAVPRALRADGRLLPAGKGPLCACRETKTQRRSKTYKDRETPEGGARAPRGGGRGPGAASRRAAGAARPGRSRGAAGAGPRQLGREDRPPGSGRSAGGGGPASRRVRRGLGRGAFPEHPEPGRRGTSRPERRGAAAQGPSPRGAFPL